MIFFLVQKKKFAWFHHFISIFWKEKNSRAGFRRKEKFIGLLDYYSRGKFYLLWISVNVIFSMLVDRLEGSISTTDPFAERLTDLPNSCEGAISRTNISLNSRRNNPGLYSTMVCQLNHRNDVEPPVGRLEALGGWIVGLVSNRCWNRGDIWRMTQPRCCADRIIKMTWFDTTIGIITDFWQMSEPSQN